MTMSNSHLHVIAYVGISYSKSALDVIFYQSKEYRPLETFMRDASLATPTTKPLLRPNWEEQEIQNGARIETYQPKAAQVLLALSKNQTALKPTLFPIKPQLPANSPQ